MEREIMANAKAARRIVVVDENDKSKAISDGPSPDIRTDPARPGFSAARMWVSHRDLVQVFRLALASRIRYGVYHAMSSAAAPMWELDSARKDLGYVPSD